MEDAIQVFRDEIDFLNSRVLFTEARIENTEKYPYIQELNHIFQKKKKIAQGNIEKTIKKENLKKELCKTITKSFFKIVFSVFHAEELLELGSSINSLLDHVQDISFELNSDGKDNLLLFCDSEAENLTRNLIAHNLNNKKSNPMKIQDLQLLCEICKTKNGKSILQKMYVGLFLIDYAQYKSTNNWNRVFARMLAHNFPEICYQKKLINFCSGSEAKFKLSYFFNNKKQKNCLIESLLEIRDSFIKNHIGMLMQISTFEFNYEMEFRGKTGSFNINLPKEEYKPKEEHGTPKLLRHNAITPIK